MPRSRDSPRRASRRLEGRVGPRHLHDLDAALAGDQATAAGGGRGGAQVAEQRALVGAAGEHQAGHGQVAQRLDHRLVERARGAARAPRDGHVQADVAGLREQRLQRRDRRALLGGDQVVVVDEHEDLGAGPPRAAAQLLGGDVGAGDAVLEVRREVAQRGLGLGGGGEVVEQVLVGDLAEQRAPVVDDDQLRLLRRAGAHDLAGQAAQDRALAGLPVAEDEQVRLGRPGRARPGPAPSR